MHEGLVFHVLLIPLFVLYSVKTYFLKFGDVKQKSSFCLDSTL